MLFNSIKTTLADGNIFAFSSVQGTKFRRIFMRPDGGCRSPLIVATSPDSLAKTIQVTQLPSSSTSASTFTVKAKNSRFVANLALISAPKGNRIP
ncbi:hypothetical protein [Burkholderia multivorans]|uniref:hypothetical protein n=1 Tax=Burkholderia multivorans TaxID=87883 RepID=UPI002ED58FC8